MVMELPWKHPQKIWVTSADSASRDSVHDNNPVLGDYHRTSYDSPRRDFVSLVKIMKPIHIK